MSKAGRQPTKLESYEWFRFQILIYLRILSISLPMKQFCEDIYGGRGASQSGQKARGAQVLVRDWSLHNERRKNGYFRLARASKSGLGTNPRYLLWVFRLLNLFRMSSTAWMIYIVVKYCILYTQPDTLVSLGLPMHCYLVGRYILHESVNQITAVMFACAHLSWRLVQSLADYYYINAFHFWLLSEAERELVYAKLDREHQSLELTQDQLKRLSPRERFLLETMCFRMNNWRHKVTFILRANRTREAHEKTRCTMAAITMTAGTSCAIISLGLTIIFTLVILSDWRYLHLYPGCDPHVERLRDEGKLRSHLWRIIPPIHLTPHRWYAAIGDGFENLLMWLEGGIVSLSAPCLAGIVSRDLYLHWAGIRAKMDQLRSLILTNFANDNNPNWMAERSLAAPPSAELDFQFRKLTAEIADFFRQLKKLNEIVSTFLNSCLIASLATCASYTYYIRKQSINQLPVGFNLTIAVLVMCICLSCSGFLRIDRFCMGTYINLCSLMAHDPLKHAHKYELTLEFYTRKRPCFTVFKQFAFTPTTFMTMIGWTFSCFCIISDLLR